MTVPSEVSELSFTGDGANVTFPVSYPIQQKSDLVVTLLLSGATVPVLQVLGTHYDVIAEGPAATPFDLSNVVMVTPPPAASKLDVARTVPITQATSLRIAGVFDAKTHENALDKITYVLQQIWRAVLALQALASLFSLKDFDVALVNVTFTTDANDVVATFAGGVVTASIPAGFTVTGVTVQKVVGGAGGKEAVMVRDWTVAEVLTLGFVTGLDVGTTYTLTLMLVSISVP